MIKWFNTIKRKPNATFITFDVVNFYPSITEQLLQKALDFAKKFTNITDLERKIITQAKHTILYHDNTPWIKTNSQDMFDVTMGSFDGEETCELVGTYILNIISSVIPKENIGLYRDDGLATICQLAPVVEHIQKKLRKEFNQLGLNITVQAHITTTDFLDITFDLAKKEYRPYTKPGNSHLYVHTEFNHPPTITKRIPKSIEARLSNISSNEAIFNKAKPAYEKALRTAGHRTTLNYQPKNPTTQNATTPKTNRQREIPWYNPPYSAHVKSNIGRKFLALIEQHFPPNHGLQHICNKNTLKLSYSCMNNMGNIIKSHNNRILKATNNQPEDKCNCRNKDNCPLPGKCTTQNVIYEATVTTPNNSKRYIGLTANSFKKRYTSHKASFTKRDKEHSTELSKCSIVNNFSRGDM